MVCRIKDQFAHFSWDIFGYLVYSPDLTPSDFLLFLQLKKSLGGCWFTTDAQVKNTVDSFFHQRPPEF